MNDLEMDKTIQAAITGKKVKNEYQKKKYILQGCAARREHKRILING